MIDPQAMQDFYESKGWEGGPGRCKKCRMARKDRRFKAKKDERATKASPIGCQAGDTMEAHQAMTSFVNPKLGDCAEVLLDRIWLLVFERTGYSTMNYLNSHGKMKWQGGFHNSFDFPCLSRGEASLLATTLRGVNRFCREAIDKPGTRRSEYSPKQSRVLRNMLDGREVEKSGDENLPMWRACAGCGVDLQHAFLQDDSNLNAWVAAASADGRAEKSLAFLEHTVGTSMRSSYNWYTMAPADREWLLEHRSSHRGMPSCATVSCGGFCCWWCVCAHMVGQPHHSPKCLACMRPFCQECVQSAGGPGYTRLKPSWFGTATCSSCESGVHVDCKQQDPRVHRG